MKRINWLEAISVLLLLIIVTTLIAVTDADLQISSLFYQSGGWPVGERFPWKLLYRIDRYPGLLLAIFGLCAAIYGSYNPEFRSWRRKGVFLVFLLALGPGLMVNAVFKDHWGRPRPREVTQFGGTKQFLQPWQPAINQHGRSFPCGHGSAAFYMAAPYFIYRRKRPVIAMGWLAGGVLFGMMMSYARIAQGAHFFSDTVWSLGMVYLVGVILSGLLLQYRETGIIPLSDRD